jgi:hypothetical protein
MVLVLLINGKVYSSMILLNPFKAGLASVPKDFSVHCLGAAHDCTPKDMDQCLQMPMYVVMDGLDDSKVTSER